MELETSDFVELRPVIQAAVVVPASCADETLAEELPQHCIEALAELLLNLVEQEAPAEQCYKCSDDENHT